MYYPSYFMVGTAIHGYQSVPVKPASHGCIRIPMFAAKKFYKMASMGMSVIVHEGVSPKSLTATSDQSQK
jgi:lipoprotein-anchoring transpeptidase ErfK/SrfK